MVKHGPRLHATSLPCRGQKQMESHFSRTSHPLPANLRLRTQQEVFDQSKFERTSSKQLLSFFSAHSIPQNERDTHRMSCAHRKSMPMDQMAMLLPPIRISKRPQHEQASARHPLPRHKDLIPAQVDGD